MMEYGEVVDIEDDFDNQEEQELVFHPDHTLNKDLPKSPVKSK
jgi:hypothetical protein